MRRPRPSVFAALVFLSASFWLGAAFVARAQFTSGATAGPLTVSTASSFGPQAPAVGIWLCLPGISITTIVRWSDASGSGSVELLRGLSPNGPFAPIGFRLPLTGAFFDTTRLFSTTVYYAISAGGGKPSAPVRLDLPDVRCRTA